MHDLYFLTSTGKLSSDLLHPPW